jgi:hypothetical protein
LASARLRGGVGGAALRIFLLAGIQIPEIAARLTAF